MVYITQYQSTLGLIYMAADQVGLTGLWFENQKYFGEHPGMEIDISREVNAFSHSTCQSVPDKQSQSSGQNVIGDFDRVNVQTDADVCVQIPDRVGRVFYAVKDWLDFYFQGKEPKMEIPLHLEGTAFQKEVWDILLSIPYGQTMTYGEIAAVIAQRRQENCQSVGCAEDLPASTARHSSHADELFQSVQRPSRQSRWSTQSTQSTKVSAQAVGGAVGHNPISIIVPCHRVLGAKRSLTGYAGGVEKKIALLGLEGVTDPSWKL